jgi:hypothetical protein
MPGLVPGIHVLLQTAQIKTWMAGTSPAMTRTKRETKSPTDFSAGLFIRLMPID